MAKPEDTPAAGIAAKPVSITADTGELSLMIILGAGRQEGADRRAEGGGKYTLKNVGPVQWNQLLT